MKLVFNPSYSSANEYANIITGYLRENGCTVYSLDELFKSPQKFFSVKIVHLNWYESVGTLPSFILKLTKLLLLLAFGKKIVWTMHNKTPHTQKVLGLQKVLQYILVKASKRIVIHSKLSEELLNNKYKIRKDKIVHIPHPNYINVYGSIPGSSKKIADKLRLLFLGAVRPYKNIELLIDVVTQFENEVELHIAGNPITEEYKNELIGRAIGNNNISFELEFVENNRMIQLLSEYDLAILPYDIRSSLNSGTIILCFSYAKTIIAPEIGTVSDIEDKSYLFSYKYNDEEEHFKNLKQQVLKAIEAKKDNSEIFNDWGAKMYEVVKKGYGSNNVQQKFIELYHSLV
ncbi:glycosyltransferase [uncultured Draconibacterium sp.]|uniref:glycosyltransferase n=1 Tax=uncultured Draconibacterium sp. TaxID=1573823 RepID=UPI003217621B